MSALTTSIILEALASAIKWGKEIKCTEKVGNEKIKILPLEGNVMVYKQITNKQTKTHKGIYKERKHLKLINDFSQFTDYEVNIQKSTLYKINE